MKEKIPDDEPCSVFSVLSALLDYPDATLVDALPEARTRLLAEHTLPRDARAGVARFFDYCAARDLVTLQENYVACFDRGRATSLYLFEHVHGESRDRGQAMVDLLQTYARHGLYLAASELPDYLPVFLEYLSRLPVKEARALLAETTDILQSLADALARRASPYGALTGALLALAGVRGVPGPAVADAPDDAHCVPSAADYRALDAAYAEEPVRFVGASVPVAEPVHFYDRRPARR